MTNDDFDILVDQLRELYASELLEENSKETQIQNLKDEIPILLQVLQHPFPSTFSSLFLY